MSKYLGSNVLLLITNSIITLTTTQTITLKISHPLHRCTKGKAGLLSIRNKKWSSAKWKLNHQCRWVHKDMWDNRVSLTRCVTTQTTMISLRSPKSLIKEDPVARETGPRPLTLRLITTLSIPKNSQFGIKYIMFLKIKIFKDNY